MGLQSLSVLLASVYAGVGRLPLRCRDGPRHTEPFSPYALYSKTVMMIIVGGPGSIIGVTLGSMFVTILPFVLLSITQKLGILFPVLLVQVANVKTMVYGAIIVVFLSTSPAASRESLRDCQLNYTYCVSAAVNSESFLATLSHSNRSAL